MGCLLLGKNESLFIHDQKQSNDFLINIRLANLQDPALEKSWQHCPFPFLSHMFLYIYNITLQRHISTTQQTNYLRLTPFSLATSTALQDPPCFHIHWQFGHIIVLGTGAPMLLLNGTIDWALLWDPLWPKKQLKTVTYAPRLNIGIFFSGDLFHGVPISSPDGTLIILVPAHPPPPAGVTQHASIMIDSFLELMLAFPGGKPQMRPPLLVSQRPY